MKSFKTLFYNIRATFYIKKYNRRRTVYKTGLVLDYEEDKEYIKYENIYNVFKDEIKKIAKSFEISKDDIEYKKSVITQSEDVDQLIEIAVIDDFLIAYNVKNIPIKAPLEYLTIVNQNSVIFKIKNPISSINYTININDKGNETIKSFNDEYEYFYKSKRFKIELSSYLDDIKIQNIKRNININELSLKQEKIKIRNQITNKHHNENKIFKSGIGYSKNIPYLSDESYTNEFDLDVIIKGATTVPKEVYPKVTASYKMTCDYDYKIDKVFGTFKYKSIIDQNGFIDIKLVKLATKQYKVQYTISCKCTMFERQSNGFYKWVTKNVDVQQSFTTNMNNKVFINNETKKVEYNNSPILEKQTGSSVYAIMLEKAKEVHGIHDKYSLHSFEIKNIRCMDGNEEIASGKESYITPCFVYNNGQVDTSKPLNYVIKPHFIFSGENHKRCYVTKTLSNIITQQDFNFPLKDQYNNQFNTDNYEYAIFILNADDFLSYSINEKTVSAKSNKRITLEDTITLDDCNNAITIDLYSKLNQKDSENSLFDCTTTVTCLKDQVICNGNTLSEEQNTVISNTGLSFYELLFGVAGVVKKVDKHEQLILPHEGHYRASINGNEITYDTALKGKEDYNSKEEPFIIPSDAFNVKVDVIISNVFPIEATITREIINSTDLTAYSCVMKLSSDYKNSIPVATDIYLETQKFKDYRLRNGYRKTYSLELSKPTGEEYREYSLQVESTNPNIILEYQKKLVFNSDSKRLDVVCLATKHPACEWNLMVDPFYCYDGEDEYFTYDFWENKEVVDNKIILKHPIKTLNPVCILNDGITLQRVISTENDGITIKEILKNTYNGFCTKYKDISVKMVTDLKGNKLDYTMVNNFTITAQEDTVIVYYKVANSFDYVNTKDHAIVTVNTVSSGNLNVYYFDKNRAINTNVSLNPIHSNIDKGFVYIQNNEEDIISHKITINRVKNTTSYIVQLLDKYNNPATGDFNIDVTNLPSSSKIIDIKKSVEKDGMFKLSIHSPDPNNINGIINITNKDKVYQININEGEV